MSRSYKKSPVSKYTWTLGKRFANKKVRHYKEPLADGSAYKRVYCQYNIVDHCSYQTLGEHLEWRTRHLAWCAMMGFEFDEDDANIRKSIQNWMKWYRRK